MRVRARVRQEDRRIITRQGYIPVFSSHKSLLFRVDDGTGAAPWSYIMLVVAVGGDSQTSMWAQQVRIYIWPGRESIRAAPEPCSRAFLALTVTTRSVIIIIISHAATTTITSTSTHTHVLVADPSASCSS